MLKLTSLVAGFVSLVILSASAAEDTKWWNDAVGQALGKAGSNRSQLEQALGKVPEKQREGLQFLIENMPEMDLKKLSANYLLENVALAYEAWEKAPWHSKVSKKVFLNEILPYASINERRDNWRKLLREKCAPLIEDCKTPSEAAQRLNQKLFKLVNVKYSTARKHADQSPMESMDSGLASCTGLSVLLIDACRSVGVPARLVGTPLWHDNRGNHTWVEIWDGRWHFTGAAEPDPKGLDRSWFVHDAEQAQKDEPEHAIYASSFAKTDLPFPMVWAEDVRYVSSVNVTDNYKPKAAAAESGKARLLVKVLDRPAGQRVKALVRVTDAEKPEVQLEGRSRDESADANNILPFEVARDRTYWVEAELGTKLVRQEVHPGEGAEPVVILTMLDAPEATIPSMLSYVPPMVTKKLATVESANLKKELADFFSAPAESREKWKFSPALDKLLADNEPAVRKAAWEAYKSAPIHSAAKEDFEGKKVRFDKYVSPYTVRTVGTKPENGWPLFIAMHGGGGAPKEVNDSQWQIMQRYYKDHAEEGGYLYLALRAPNDTWNGFYDVYVYPLIENLIKEFLLFGDVDA
ncbi:MAG TPA: transglutaminase-like domain-containing protein, partial [Verrucomicrobiae bacterium]